MTKADSSKAFPLSYFLSYHRRQVKSMGRKKIEDGHTPGRIRDKEQPLFSLLLYVFSIKWSCYPHNRQEG